MQEKWIIFTDLDGTLLSWNYKFDKTKPIVERLKKAKIPLIFCTSKTKAENEYYQKALNIKYPFIIENGGAIFIPKGYFNFEFEYSKIIDDYFIIELGETYKNIRKALNEIRDKYKLDFIGFGDLSNEEVAKETGLPLHLAKLAKEKQYNESIKFLNPNERKLEILKQELKKYKLKVDKGTRYLNIHSITADKGKAVSILLNLFKKQYKKIKSLSIGDGINDLPMLQTTDIGCLVKHKNGEWVNIKDKNIIKINAINGDGFNQAIRHFIFNEQ